MTAIQPIGLIPYKLNVEDIYAFIHHGNVREQADYTFLPDARKATLQATMQLMHPNRAWMGI